MYIYIYTQCTIFQYTLISSNPGNLHVGMSNSTPFRTAECVNKLCHTMLLPFDPTRFPNSGYSSLIGQVGRGGAIDGATRCVAHDENQSASLGHLNTTSQHAAGLIKFAWESLRCVRDAATARKLAAAKLRIYCQRRLK